MFSYILVFGFVLAQYYNSLIQFQIIDLILNAIENHLLLLQNPRINQILCLQ